MDDKPDFSDSADLPDESPNDGASRSTGVSKEKSSSIGWLERIREVFRRAQTPIALTPEGKRTFLEKWSTTILCLTLFAMPFVLTGAVKSLKVYRSDVWQWLPKGFEEAKVYNSFKERFGVDEMVVVSWEGCRIDQPQLRQLQEALEQIEIDGNKLFSQIITGPDIVARIRRGGVSESSARRRIGNLLVGDDGSTSCLLAYPEAKFLDDRRQIVALIYQTAEEILELQPEEIRLGGPTADGAAVEAASKQTLGTFLWMSVVLVFALTWYRMRDLPLTLIVIFFSALCASVSLAIMYFTNGKMNLTMVMLPTLTFILGVSGSIHMVNYYRKASTLGFGMRSADQALVDGVYPVLMSSTTTAIGLLSLATSSVKPMKLFGVYAASGVMASTLILLLTLPASLYLLRGRISQHFSKEGKMDERERLSGVSRSTSSLLNWVCRRHGLVVLPTLIAVVVLGLGILKLRVSVKLQNRFANKTKIIEDYEWLESKLGPLVPMEVEIHFDPSNKLNRWDQMQMVQSIERAIKQTTAVNATFSAGTFEPYIPKSTFGRRTRIMKWKAEFDKLQEAKLVKVDGDDTYWRISLRVAALNDIDYGKFIESVRLNVDEQIAHMEQPGVSAKLTGGIPLIYKAQHQILSDLMASFLTAFLIITFIMICVLRSIQAGIVAMVPNIFPPLVVFGAMGWFGFSIEIGSVMTASVALGIAVDDTLHFLTWYRRGTVEGLSRFASIRHAFEHCAKAMIDTSLICGLGVLPLLFGIFMPVVKFATLLLIMLMTALPGDLVLLPAILVGPVGVLFRLGRGGRNTENSDETEIEGESTEPITTIRRER